MTLRPATPEDAGEIYAIKHEAYGDLATRAYGQWNELFHREFTRGLVPCTRMIEVDGITVGWMAVTSTTDADEIVDVHIRPAFQRRGIGSEVVRAVLRTAGDRSVMLHVLKINPARSLYERHGFRAVGETSTHTIMKNDVGPNRVRKS